MKCGDVIFVINENLIGEAIEFFDHGNYSHVCLAISDTHILETDLFTNARIVPFQYINFELISLDLTDIQRSKIPDIAQKLVGKKYDYLLIVYYMLKGLLHLKKPWMLPRHEICSGLVDNVLFQIGEIPELEFLSGESPNMMYEKIKLLAVKE